MTPASVTQALLDAAASDACGIRFLDDGDERIGYAEIVARSRRAAALLRRRGVARGEHLPVILPTGPAFVATFYGAILAGAIPCPISMPFGFGSQSAFVERVVSTCRYVRARHVAVSEDVADLLAPALPGLSILTAAELGEAPADPAFTPHSPAPEEVAFLQCTSGSTAAPKGVMLSHRNLAVNTSVQMRAALAVGPGDVMVSWLPLNHDMGLIAGVLLPLFVGFDAVLMSPGRFMRRPASWLRAISDFRGTISPSPSFGFSYVLTRVTDEDMDGIDLASWRSAPCGAEPIDGAVLRRFTARFAAAGLPATALRPCYGLAEASLAVSFHSVGPASHDLLEREALAGGEAVPVGEGQGGVEIANCGAPVDGTRVRVVDDGGAELPDGRIGRIEIAGPSVMMGYHDLPEETAAKIRDGWLDTGDLGYLVDGQLRITGRTQDLIVIRGKKYHPTDFERAAELIDGVRRSVGFGVPSPEHARDLLYVVCETEEIPESVDAVCHRIADTVAARTGLRPDRVLVTSVRRAIAKTTSGKLQRQKTKELVLSGRFGVPWKAA